MSVTLLIPTALRLFTGEQAEVQVDAQTVGEALTALTVNYPDLKTHLFTDKGTLRSFVNVYINEDDIRQKNGLDTRIGPQ